MLFPRNNKVVDEECEETEQHFDKAIELAEKKNFENAIFFFDKALKITPHHVRSIYNKAVVLEKTNQTRDSEFYYTLSMYLVPIDAERIKAAKGNFLTSLPNCDALKNTVLTMRRNTNGAWETSYGPDIRILTEFGIKYGKSGDNDKALHVFDILVKLNPKNPTALHYRGFALYKLGKFNESMENYEECLKIVPDDPSTLVEKGRLLDAQSKFEEAILCYKKVISIHEKKTLASQIIFDALQNLTADYFSIKQYNDAKESCDSFLKLNPNNTGMLLNKSRIHFMLGQKNESINICKDVLGKESNNQDAISLYNYLVQ